MDNAVSRTINTAPARMIGGLMIFTMAFSIIGQEIKSTPNKPGETGFGVVKPGVQVNALGQVDGRGPFLVIVGGTIAWSLLALLSHAGEAGEKLGVGLAAVAFTTAVLVNGKPVWDRANQAFGSTPTTPLQATTPSTRTVGAAATTEALAPTIAAGI